MKTVSKKLILMLVALMTGILCGCSPEETIETTEEGASEAIITEMKGMPLTMEALKDGKITISNPLKLIIKYSRNDGKWISSSSETISISCSAGDRIGLFGNNAAYTTISDDSLLRYTNIQCSAPFYIYGNIMSLVDSEGYESATELMGSYTFALLFSYNDQLVTHPEKPLVLPATTLTDGCYGAMFEGCSGLTSAPALPATTLASNCYYGMFEGCTGLTSAPALPARTLADYCYFCMFAGCTSLTSAPELPATTLVQYCYALMFSGCSSLNYIKMLATDISATDCMRDWVSGVAENGSFERNPESTWVKTGDSGIPIGWSVINGIIIPDDYERPPLTLQAIEDGIITISNPQKLTIIYGKPGTMWSSSSDETITIPCAAGEKLYLRGDNAAYSLSNISKYTNIQCSSPCYIYGNIMSLVDRDGYESATELIGSYTFACLFKGNKKIVNHPEMPLLLPATTLASYCYYTMFGGCTGLTVAPALPATTLTDGCYARMFTGCTGLSSTPELPATTLASYCYQYMFEGCTGLTTAPALPATTLAKSCYFGMFYGCAGLSSAPELPATTLSSYCYQYMFEDCTGLTSAPALPATTLAESCYRMMFSGCSSLNYIKMLATDVSATNCMKDWVSGVAASGTFVKNKKATWDRSGVSGIPEGWAIESIGIITTDGDYAPLTFKAIEDGAVIISNPLRLTIKYGHPGEQFSSSSDEIINLPYVAGEAVCLLGDNATYAMSNSESDYTNVKCTSPCYLYGNIMSLVNSEDYESATKLEHLAFTGLFRDNANIIIRADRPLLLPATTLAFACYDSMFYGCTSLTSAPDLPATTLASSCYSSMFYGCTSLTSAPELPATTLASSCYSYMFYGCTGLTSAPELPATTLASSCYNHMFYRCTGLTSAPELPATTLASSCYSGMFDACRGLTTAPELPATTLASGCYNSMFAICTSLTSAPKLPATTLALGCYSGMFSYCTGLTTAPELPAITLNNSCYSNMFRGCTSLNYIKMMATDISATDCMKGWVSGVAKEGTFVKNEESTWNVTGASGIPEGWTVQSVKP